LTNDEVLTLRRARLSRSQTGQKKTVELRPRIAPKLPFKPFPQIALNRRFANCCEKTPASVVAVQAADEGQVIPALAIGLGAIDPQGLSLSTVPRAARRCASSRIAAPAVIS